VDADGSSLPADSQLKLDDLVWTVGHLLLSLHSSDKPGIAYTFSMALP